MIPGEWLLSDEPVEINAGRPTVSLTVHSLDRWVEPVRGCRSIAKHHMVRNNATPDIQVDLETHDVYVDGELASVEPADRVPMSQLYYVV